MKKILSFILLFVSLSFSGFAQQHAIEKRTQEIFAFK